MGEIICGQIDGWTFRLRRRSWPKMHGCFTAEH